MIAARIGAIFYVLWGLLHLSAAWSVCRFATTLGPGMAQGRLYQTAAYLLFFACAALTIACLSAWRNGRQGYWMNGLLIAVADVPFVIFVLAPGYMPWWPGLLGPILWLLAFGFTSYARIFADLRLQDQGKQVEPRIVSGP